MKHTTFGIVIGIMIILTLVCILTINGKKTRRDDMENALAISVENAVETTMNEKTYSIENNKEFIADFTQNLLLQISNDSEIEVKVAKLDHTKGLMAVRVTETFTHPNGKEGKNECDTTVVFERVPTEAELVTIAYQLDADKKYKVYQLTKGDRVIVPREPSEDDKIFDGWVLEGTNSIVTDFGTADEDQTYIAVFH